MVKNRIYALFVVYELRIVCFVYLEKEESDLLSVSSLIVIDGYLGGLDRVDSSRYLKRI